VADIIVDGKTRASWVPTISNTAAPTVAELNAGMLLQSTLTADGLSGFQPETASVDTTSLASTFNTSRVGRSSFDGATLRFKKQDGTDTIYDTLTRETTGYIVVRRSIDEGTSWAASQKVSVYPAQCGEVVHMDPEENTVERYEVPLQIIDSPELRAVVAA
jgi:hypothetical protein